MIYNINMSKKTIFLISFIIVVIASVGYVVQRNSQAKLSEPSNIQKVSEMPATKVTQQNPNENLERGNYVEYSEEAFANAGGQKVLFFHAPWCYQCRLVDEDLTQEGAPNGYTVFKVDFDNRQDLRKKYGVTFRTAFVKVDESGNKIGDEYIAYSDPSLAAVERDFLN